MKINPSTRSSTVTFRTSDKYSVKNGACWWEAGSDKELKDALLGTASFLKESQNYRYRQAAIYARLYGNMSLYSFVGASISQMDKAMGLPSDRPTFNLVQSAVDTLTSRITQSRPAPIFLTNNGDYKERNLAKKLNNFILGEFYQTKAYDKVALAFRDALVEGTGCLHVYEHEKKAALERVLLTELLIDPSESVYGEPRQMYRIKLVDRAVLAKLTGKAKTVDGAEQAYVDNSADSSKTVSDLVMVVEGWRLPSSKDAKDGRHTLACTNGVLFDETYTKDKFPFVFIHYSPRLLGFWAQGVAEQLMGTQLEINSLLYTISKSIKLVGVPRIFEEVGSKVLGASHNNDIGAIIKYQGTKPSYEVAPCVPQELYAQLERLIKFGYQQCGVSALDAGAQKPAGLNSGEAIRTYDDISTDRAAAVARRYDNIFIELAYMIMDLAKDIAKRDGKYETIYPGKNGIQQIDLPKVEMLENPYVIQCLNMSSLPKDPAGRLAKVTEMVQSGMITIREGRRLLDFPDLDQVERLANAAEERIFQQLDAIIEDGEYSPPDTFTDLELADQFVVQYINLYSGAKLEEEKMQQLRDYYAQVGVLKSQAQAAMAPQPVAGAQLSATPQAVPEAPPSSPLIPNAPGQGGLAT